MSIRKHSGTSAPVPLPRGTTAGLLAATAVCAGLVVALTGFPASAAPAASAGAARDTAFTSAAPARIVPPRNGLYVDALSAGAPKSAPHYILALGPTRDGDFKGAVNFIYQDGRIGFVGRYTGEVTGNGRLTMRFAHGKVLRGTYGHGVLRLGRCASVMRFATRPGSCTFTYRGFAGG